MAYTTETIEEMLSRITPNPTPAQFKSWRTVMSKFVVIAGYVVIAFVILCVGNAVAARKDEDDREDSIAATIVVALFWPLVAICAVGFGICFVVFYALPRYVGMGIDHRIQRWRKRIEIPKTETPKPLAEAPPAEMPNWR